MFQWGLTWAYTEARPSLLLRSAQQQVGWGCTRWEDTQPGQRSPGDSRPYNLLLGNKLREGWLGAAGQGPAGHQSAGGEELFSFASLFLGFYSSLFVILLFITIYNYHLISIIKLFVSQITSFLTFTLPVLFPPSCWGSGVIEQLCGA